MMQNCYEFDNSNYSSSTTKDENEPELEALERSSSTSKDLNQQPKRSSQPHVSYVSRKLIGRISEANLYPSTALSKF